MKNQDLYDVFVEELGNMLSCENQIIEALPDLIKMASSNDLREALASHLEETENQIKRIENIFSILELVPTDKNCIGMEGILREGNEMLKGRSKNSTVDAIIINAAQKVEHYEMASYGTLRSFANTLDLDGDVVSLLQETLDEEGAADKKLTKIAVGTLFSQGVNSEAAEPSKNKRDE